LAIGPGVSGTWTNELRLSTTSKAPDGLSQVFSENAGSDERIVMPAAQRQFGATFVNLNPPPFTGIFQFDTPFLYNPSQGNLLLDFRVFALGYTFPPEGFSVDFVSRPGDGVSILLAGGANPTTGVLDTSGAIFQFGYTPVPEPSAVVLVGLGGVTILFAGYRRRRLQQGERGTGTHVHD
jgi:hypothetical protein